MKVSTLEYELGGVTFVGELARPDTQSGPRPGILVMHEGNGITEHAKRRARELAERGYVALAADMFGGGNVAPSLAEGRPRMMALRSDLDLLRGRVNAGLTALKAQPGVDTKRLGAIGFCFGGLCVLDLARTGADVAGVASFHGIFTPPGNLPEPRIRARVAVYHGWEDALVPPEQVVALGRELSGAGCDWQIHCFGGAVHGFTHARPPEEGIPFNALADKRSWQAAEGFLAECFA